MLPKFNLYWLYPIVVTLLTIVESQVIQILHISNTLSYLVGLFFGILLLASWMLVMINRRSK